MIDIEKIADDIINFKYIHNYHMVNYTYYENFIMFLRTSIIYNLSASGAIYQSGQIIRQTMNFAQLKKNEVIENLKQIDLNEIYKYIHQKNIFVTNTPKFDLYYKKHNEIFIQSFSIFDFYQFPSTNEITILYMININSKTIRLTTLSNSKNFFIYKIVKKRKLIERKEKLKKINEI